MCSRVGEVALEDTRDEGFERDDVCCVTYVDGCCRLKLGVLGIL